MPSNALLRTVLLGTRDPNSPLRLLRAEADILEMIWSFTRHQIFTVNVRTVAPVYDSWVFVRSSVHDSSEEAIVACRALYVKCVRENFRDPSDTDIYGVEFNPEKLEEYTREHMSNLYHNGGQPDARSPWTNPGGPAVAQVIEFAKDHGGEWLEEVVLYQLPVQQKPFYTGQCFQPIDTTSIPLTADDGLEDAAVEVLNAFRRLPRSQKMRLKAKLFK